ncbi:ATP-binding protein [Gammaproteobacteria bacterium AS21]
MIKKLKLIYFSSVVITMIMATALISDLIQINELNRIRQKDAQLSFVWFLQQADREAREFYDKAMLYHMGNDQVTKQQLLTKFDIFWSRFDPDHNSAIISLAKTIKSGPEFLHYSRLMLVKLDPVVQNISPGDVDSFNEISVPGAQYFKQIYKLSINALHARQINRNEQLDTLKDLYIDLSLTLFALVLSALLALGLFFKRGRQLESQNLIFEKKVHQRTLELKASNELLVKEASVRQESDKKSTRLISAFNQSKEVVFILDSTNKFIFFNERFKQINETFIEYIYVGAPFDRYLKSVIADNNQAMTNPEKLQWVGDWLKGLKANENSFELTLNSGQQFIFNIDKLDDGSVIVIGADISALKETQQALKESERRFRNFALIGADWYWEMSKDLSFTFLAGGVEGISGFPTKHFVGKSKADNYGISGRLNIKSLNKYIEKVESKEPFQDLETKWQRADGSVVSISLSAEPQYDEKGVFIGYIGAGRDVTQRCLVEELDKRLIAAIDSLNLMVSIYDENDILVFHNKQFEDFMSNANQDVLLGYSYSHLWQVFTEYFVKENGHLIEENFNRARDSHRRQKDSFVLPLGADQYLNIFEQVLDDNGVIIIATDISKDKKTEQEILFLRNYLANVIDSISSVLIGVDKHARVTQWNLAAQKETGLSLQDTYQKNVVDVFPRLATELPAIEQAICSSKESKQLKRLFVKDEGTYYEDIIISPLVSDGECGAVIRLDDVTEQVLISEMMIQTEKMLSIGGLAAGMAHEINNPLAGIMQTADVMSNRLANSNMPANQCVAESIGVDIDKINLYMQKRGVLSMLSSIVSSGKRMANIVDNMLDFSRQNEASSIEQCIISLLDKSLELSIIDHNLKYDYEFKNIEIIKDYDSDIPFIKCEGGKIQQVFLNILRNAAQAMQEANTVSPTIIFKVRFDALIQHVIIEIEDNGPGIDEDIQRRIFEPFFTTKKVGIGTGLGLSVSYFIITENHKGNLTVSSKQGENTKFTISLPKSGG